MIRVVLPFHLRTLAGIPGEVALDLTGPVTLRAIFDAIEARHPTLRGTIREHGTLKRRRLVRFYACKEDWSEKSPDAPLPEEISRGTEPLLVIGAMAGG
jgi:molybdopterin synthase sulfur carrier subunit